MRSAGDERAKALRRALAVVFLASVGMLLLYQWPEHVGEAEHQESMLAAARIMEAGAAAIKACREARGMSLEESEDVNATGLLGVRYSPLTTTVGNLEAKRTTTNPNMAGLVAKLLLDAGSREGDVVAIGASGSFPALVLATLSAARALNLRPVLIYSMGASQWGANELEFTWLEMEECLVERGILAYRVVALSLGGDADRATELDPATGASMRARAQVTGTPVIESPDLLQNVRQRMEIYRSQAEGTRIAAFVNIGGTWANLGTDPSVLALKPGLDCVTSLPDPMRRGVLFEMAKWGIPVVHLLNMKGLVARYGLPWDPVPLPPVGDGAIYHENGQPRRWQAAIAGTYLASTLALALLRRRRHDHRQ